MVQNRSSRQHTYKISRIKSIMQAQITGSSDAQFRSFICFSSHTHNLHEHWKIFYMHTPTSSIISFSTAMGSIFEVKPDLTAFTTVVKLFTFSCPLLLIATLSICKSNEAFSVSTQHITLTFTVCLKMCVVYSNTIGGLGSNLIPVVPPSHSYCSVKGLNTYGLDHVIATGSTCVLVLERGLQGESYWPPATTGETTWPVIAI